MSVSTLPSPSATDRRLPRAAVVAMLVMASAGLAAPPSSGAQSPATTPPTPGASTAAATFTIPDGTTALPTIAADGDTAAWSVPEDGRWTLHAAVDGTAIDRVFDRQRWPIDVSVGHATGGKPVVLFSSCAASTAPTRVRAQGCDLERLSSVTSGGRPVRLVYVSGRSRSSGLRGASTKVGSETAPSLSGSRIVFARTNAARLHGSLIARDIRTGAERTLPHGALGRCSGPCAKDGFAAGAPLATSLSGTRFGALWESINGPDSFGIAANDEVLRGSVTSTKLGRSAGTSVISGTDSAIAYGSVQQLGSTTQAVRHAYDGENAAPAPGSQDVVQRVTSTGDVSVYADPAGRRIVAAASAGDTLWLIHDSDAVPAGTAPGALPPRCSAAVGGCTIESIQEPAFTPVDRQA